ncbi:hypothetical protein HDU67_006899 [Dinochytrium kinnereticum]|nr:hypothetical protein HDU67_006899 [Dinochytrium kinnereticum]
MLTLHSPGLSSDEEQVIFVPQRTASLNPGLNANTSSHKANPSIEADLRSLHLSNTDTELEEAEVWEKEASAKETAMATSPKSDASPANTSRINIAPSRISTPTSELSRINTAPVGALEALKQSRNAATNLKPVNPNEHGGHTTDSRKLFFSLKTQEVIQKLDESSNPSASLPFRKPTRPAEPFPDIDPELAFIKSVDTPSAVSASSIYKYTTNAGYVPQTPQRANPNFNVLYTRSRTESLASSSSGQGRRDGRIDIAPRSYDRQKVPFVDMRIRDKYLHAHFTHLYREPLTSSGESPHNVLGMDPGMSPEAQAMEFRDKFVEGDGSPGFRIMPPDSAEWSQVMHFEENVHPHITVQKAFKPATNTVFGLVTPEPEEDRLSPKPAVRLQRWIGSPPEPNLLLERMVTSPSQASEDFDHYRNLDPDRPIDMISVDELLYEDPSVQFPKRSSSKTRDI